MSYSSIIALKITNGSMENYEQEVNDIFYVYMIYHNIMQLKFCKHIIEFDYYPWVCVIVYNGYTQIVSI